METTVQDYDCLGDGGTSVMERDGYVVASPRASSADARCARTLSGAQPNTTAECFNLSPRRRGRLSTTSAASMQRTPSESRQSRFDIEDEFCTDWQCPQNTPLDWPLSRQEKETIVTKPEEANERLPMKGLQYLEPQLADQLRQLLETKAACVCDNVFMDDSMGQSTATSSSHPHELCNIISLDTLGDDCSKRSQCETDETESNLDGRESLLSFSEIGSQYSSRNISRTMLEGKVGKLRDERKMLENLNLTMKRCSMLEGKVGKLREERNSFRRELAAEQEKRAARDQEVKKLKSDNRKLCRVVDKMEEDIKLLEEQLDIAEKDREDCTCKMDKCKTTEPSQWSSWFWQS